MECSEYVAIVKFCAEEVERQERGPIQVFNMFEAWLFAIDAQASGEWSTARLDVIRRLGKLVEPTKNDDWRAFPHRLGDDDLPAPVDIPRLLSSWATTSWERDPDAGYLAFQRVHPFRDGNGRVGKILYNLLRGSMDAPAIPPNFFGVSNP